MIQRVISGVLVVFSMRFVLLTHLLEHKVWMNSARKFAKEFTPQSQHLTQLISCKWWGLVCNKFLTKDLHVLKFYQWLEHKTTCQTLYRKWINYLRNARMLDSLELLKFQEILDK
jgi:hypothetical protein